MKSERASLNRPRNRGSGSVPAGRGPIGNPDPGHFGPVLLILFGESMARPYGLYPRVKELNYPEVYITEILIG